MKLKKNQVLIKEMVNKTVCAHTGKKWECFLVRSNIVNYKVGEFIFTKKKTNEKK